MRIEYKQDSRRKYVILSGGRLPDREAYPFRMLAENEIRGFFPCRIEEIDGTPLFFYDITDWQPLRIFLEKRDADRQLLETLFYALADGLEMLERYLLPMNSLQTDPELLFTDPAGHRICLICYPDTGSDFREQLADLSEYLLAHLKHEDRAAVAAGYAFYQKCAEGELTADTLRRLIQIRNTGEPGRHGPDKKQETAFPEETDQDEPWQQDWLFPPEREPGGRQNAGFPGAAIPLLLAALLTLAAAAGTGMLLYYYLYPGRIREALAGAAIPAGAGGIAAAVIWIRQRMKRQREGGQTGTGRQTGEQIPPAPDRKREPGSHPDPVRIRNEEHTVILSGTGEEGHAEMRNVRAVLRPAAGGSSMMLFLKKDSHIIGKNPRASDLVLRDPAVSRVHAKLTWVNGRYALTDLHSLNGCCVNGIPLVPGTPAYLQEGDEILLADRSYRYEQADYAGMSASVFPGRELSADFRHTRFPAADALP